MLNIDSPIKFKVTKSNEIVIAGVDNLAKQIKIPDFVTLQPKNYKNNLSYSWMPPFSYCYSLSEIYVDNKPDVPLDCSCAFRYMQADQLKVRFSHPECIVNTSKMFENSQFQLLDIQPEIITNVIDAQGMFSCCNNLKKIKMQHPWNAKKLQNAQDMFGICIMLDQVDISTWKQKSINSIDGMFMGCNMLRQLKFGQICLENVKSLDAVFQSCWNLSEVDLQNVKGLGNNLYQMRQTFYHCEGLRSLDLQNIDTTNVENFNQCFKGCASLEYLNISNWKFDYAENMQEMFSGCLRLQNLDTSRWNLSNVQYMTETFMGCQQLKVIDQSHWELGNIEDMSSCFRRCENLQKLNTSMWNLPSDVSAFDMFNGCKFIDTSSLYWYKELKRKGLA